MSGLGISVDGVISIGRGTKRALGEILNGARGSRWGIIVKRAQ